MKFIVIEYYFIMAKLGNLHAMIWCYFKLCFIMANRDNLKQI